jgi:hypothetical protein
MKKHINVHDFHRAFVDYNRCTRFTYNGKEALFEYLEELEQDCDIEIQLDVIGLCCEYAEYSSLEDFHHDYNSDDYPTLDSIREQTPLIEVEGGGFIVWQF